MKVYGLNLSSFLYRQLFNTPVAAFSALVINEFGFQESPSESVEAALDAGYRLIDTAFFYQNEPDVGEGIERWIKKGGGKREDIFVTTKVSKIKKKLEYT